MARSDFIAQMKAMGYEVEELGGRRIAFPYIIPVGRFAGQQIKMGFEVGEDFPLTPPSGPHLSPQLLPLNPAQLPHPAGGIHSSNFGGDWEYWSRPFPNWAGTNRTANDYMRHIRHLFDTQ